MTFPIWHNAEKRMAPIRFFSFGCLIVFLTLTGFGCKKPKPLTLAPGEQPPSWLQKNLANNQPKKTDEAPSSLDPRYVEWLKGKRTPLNETVPRQVLYLQQVMRNFSLAESFRARLSIPMEDRLVTGEVEYKKDRGMHGTLYSQGTPSLETFVIRDKVFAKSGATSTWLNLSHTDEGREAAALLKNAFRFSPAEEKENAISEHAKVLQVSEDPNGCTNYQVTQYGMASEGKSLFICVKNDLPVLITLIAPEGKTEIAYRDFGQDIPLNPPTGE